MSGQRPARILVAELGPGDAAEATAHDLRDTGAEVVYVTGGSDADGAARLAAIAVQEDADLLVAPGAQPAFLTRLRAELARLGADDVPVRGGGASAGELLDAAAGGSGGAS